MEQLVEGREMTVRAAIVEHSEANLKFTKK